MVNKELLDKHIKQLHLDKETENKIIKITRQKIASLGKLQRKIKIAKDNHIKRHQLHLLMARKLKIHMIMKVMRSY